MNDTAKKLRDITQNAGVAPGSGKPYSVIAAIKSAFGFDSISAAGVLLQFMAAIADELDELQARAEGANNLRQKLDSAEKKAERRKKQVEHTEDAIRERNARLKMRAELLEQAVNENRELRKQVPSERERQILDMWPKFEDGEYVMLGDGFMGCGGVSDVVELLDFEDDNVRLWGESGCDIDLGLKPVIKRPTSKVLDADGVPIRKGDTVWFKGKPTEYKVTVVLDGTVYLTYKNRNGDSATATTLTCNLTHTRPDSWERLEEDAADLDDMPCDFNAKDLIRRAKALAGVEVGR